MDLAATINNVLGFLTIIAQVAIVVLLFAILTNSFPKHIDLVRRNALWLALTVAVTATLGSLVYSDVIGYEPCKLCWFQRAFMYPQVVLLGMAVLRKDHNIARYSLVLSGLGAILAGYHYLLQFGAAPALPCAAGGSVALCAQRFVLQFGYITIPLMTLTAFLLMAALMLVVMKRPHKNSVSS